VKFEGVTWGENEDVHIILEETREDQLDSALCGQAIPTEAGDPEGYNHQVCAYCRRAQDLINRGTSLDEAKKQAVVFRDGISLPRKIQ
jgi:hypothetical protein